ncbi:MAG TPA: hypothetical protein VF897_14330, partial [Roseiflexaceae bacterium]
TTTRVFRVLPPDAEAWAVAAGLPPMPRRTCPATSDQRSATTESDPSSVVVRRSSAVVPALLTPAPGTVFSISPGIPRDRQRIVLQAQAGADAAKLTIYLDGKPLATFSAPPYRAFWPLAPGAHRALVEAQDERGKVRRSVEVEFVVEGH